MVDYIEYNKLINWSKRNKNVRAVILTSSRANPHGYRDILSDYDVELYVRDLQPFYENDHWYENWGDVLVKWPLEPQSTGMEGWITRLVQYRSCCRFDMQITDRNPLYHENFDAGYTVVLDKDGLTEQIPPADYSRLKIQKPTEKEFMDRVNSFLWDILYIPKSLLRDELFYTRYMMDSIIRFECLKPFIEWYIGMENHWDVGCNKLGREFKKYLKPALWKQIKQTFADGEIKSNWLSLYQLLDLGEFLAGKIAEALHYPFPETQFTEIKDYIKKLQQLDLS